MLIREDDVQMPLRLLCYISPLRWGIATASYVEFIDTKYGGAQPWNDSYICPDLPNQMNCLGSTGEQVLKSMHVMFSVVSPEGNVVRNILILVGLCLAVKFGYAAVFIARCSASRTITAPEFENVADSQETGIAVPAAVSLTADSQGQHVVEEEEMPLPMPLPMPTPIILTPMPLPMFPDANALANALAIADANEDAGPFKIERL